ncbi:GMC oxidoreductase [Conyzicola sp.]|uniref:GMC oxidoreductase n=1 Tax=Conyzicola sp. TaxID=1969404 RepID=UPI003989CFDA
MSIITTPPNDHETFDCCVVGAGPVGLTVALEAASAGQRVLLLDAGTATAKDDSAALAARPPSHVVDPATHAPMEQATRRGLGGASWLWGGRCVQFEPVDFEPRAHIADSGWPLTYADVAPWQAAAATYLDCGVPTFRSDAGDWSGLGEVEVSQLERWARQPKLAARLGTWATEHPGISVLCEATVTDITFDDDDVDGAGTRVTRLRVGHEGRTVEVRARNYVLACGGLETTRLLLSVQRRLPPLFGGTGGPLGRYYMGHLQGSIATLQLTDAADIRDLDLGLDEHNVYVRRRFSFSARAQRERGLLNTSFHVDNPPFYEPGHHSSTLSLVFLALSTAPIGRRILAEGIRLRHIGPEPRQYAPHLRNVARRPFHAAADVVQILRKRYLSPVRKPGFVLRNTGGTYGLHYHGEQVPNPDSRVTLNDSTGADGQPGLDIDFRYSQQDVDSVIAAHEHLDERLRASGRGRLVYLEAEEERGASVRAQASDGFHHIGTTRMSADPADGVVDSDCRVHGVDNLFVASSSVFRTSGEANPTFLAACLAVRLARHLAAAAARELEANSQASPATSVDSGPLATLRTIELPPEEERKGFRV